MTAGLKAISALVIHLVKIRSKLNCFMNA